MHATHGKAYFGFRQSDPAYTGRECRDFAHYRKGQPKSSVRPTPWGGSSPLDFPPGGLRVRPEGQKVTRDIR